MIKVLVFVIFSGDSCLKVKVFNDHCANNDVANDHDDNGKHTTAHENAKLWDTKKGL